MLVRLLQEVAGRGCADQDASDVQLETLQDSWEGAGQMNK